MKKNLVATLIMMGLVLVSLIAFSESARAQDSVNVTFWANTSTVPDTLRPISFVQVRGDDPFLGPWGPSSKAILTNVGGDYWKGTFKFPKGKTIPFKLFTNHNSSLTSETEHNGWEQDLQPVNDRQLTVGQRDTTLPLQFVNGSPDKQNQYWRPYRESDSVDVWFRVNMQANEGFLPGQILGVRGSKGELDWGRTLFLNRETQHGNGGSRAYDGTQFWSRVVRMPKVTADETVYYKFVIHNPNDLDNPAAWEDGIPHGPPDVEPGGGGNPARIFTLRANTPDTTLYWKFWANQFLRGFQGRDTVVITFRANMQQAISERGFSIGDTLRFFTGYGGSALAVRPKQMTRVGLTTIYSATDTIVTQLGTSLSYQYYLEKNGAQLREIFYDFTYKGTDVALAERRRVTFATKTVTVNDTSSLATDVHRMPRFRNTRKLIQAVTVQFTCDARPAIYQILKGDSLRDIQGTTHVKRADSVRSMGVYINGPAAGGWATWGPQLRADSTRRMYDDGTRGDDVKGDSIYSRILTYTTNDIVGQEFKFGIGGGDNEGGFGNNHIENVSDLSPSFAIGSQFGSIDPIFYNAWDFDKRRPKPVTSVGDGAGLPLAFELHQNYPNPFNPATTIEYTLPTDGLVAMKVYNILGQEVATLVNEKQTAGRHTINFDALKLASGVYFYRITAGPFVETKKMMLMK